MAKEFPIIRSALSGSSAPRAMENRGAPPIPNRLANAVIMLMTEQGKTDACQCYVDVCGMADIDAVHNVI